MRKNPAKSGGEDNNAGWNSYNNKNALSYGFEYKEGRFDVSVRHSKHPKKVWSFAVHPPPKMFYLMENYPTLVGLDDTALMKLVLSQETMSEENEKKSKEIEALKAALDAKEEEQVLHDELHRANEECERQRQTVRNRRQQRSFEAQLHKHKEKVEAEKKAVKEVHVAQLEDILRDREAISAKMESMERTIIDLKFSSERSQRNYVQCMELLNLTVSALGKLQELPKCIESLQNQIEFRNLPHNAILSDFAMDMIAMIATLPNHFENGDSDLLQRQINSRIYGPQTGAFLKTILPDGEYTFADFASKLPTVTQFDMVYKSVKVQTTTMMTRRNKECKKLLSNFSLKDIIFNLNRYDAQLEEEEYDSSDKDYFLYCLSQKLIREKDSLVESAYEVMEPIKLSWHSSSFGKAMRCNLVAGLRYYYRFQSTLKVVEHGEDA